MKPSTTKLGKMLCELGVVDEPFTAHDLKKREGPSNVSDETYGKRSFIYVGCGGEETRREVERKLRRKGVTTINKDYSPGYGTMSVQVTYFKGFHHDI